MPNQDLVQKAINNCVDNSKKLITRGEFACLAFELSVLGNNLNFYEFYDLENNSEANAHFSYLKSNSIFIECEASGLYSCKDRPIAVGELLVDIIVLLTNKIPKI